jgi:hypothetical protein
MVADA